MTICLAPISADRSLNSDLKNSLPIPYQVAVQVKYLHLEAEVESLLCQLRNLNKQRLATTSTEIKN